MEEVRLTELNAIARFFPAPHFVRIHTDNGWVWQIGYFYGGRHDIPLVASQSLVALLLQEETPVGWKRLLHDKLGLDFLTSRTVKRLRIKLRPSLGRDEQEWQSAAGALGWSDGVPEADFGRLGPRVKALLESIRARVLLQEDLIREWKGGKSLMDAVMAGVLTRQEADLLYLLLPGTDQNWVAEEVDRAEKAARAESAAFLAASAKMALARRHRAQLDTSSWPPDRVKVLLDLEAWIAAVSARVEAVFQELRGGPGPT